MVYVDEGLYISIKTEVAKETRIRAPEIIQKL